MPHAISQTSTDIISDILNWVCPGCGGPMGGRTKEFKCQGECQTDWRDVWERRVGKPAKNGYSSEAPYSQYKAYATTEVVREGQP